MEAEPTQHAIFGPLVEAHPGPVSRMELATMLGDQVAARDGVEALRSDGVANVAGDLVSP
jgi:hypothetical protein